MLKSILMSAATLAISATCFVLLAPSQRVEAHVSHCIKREITDFGMPGLRGDTDTAGRAFLIRARRFCVAGG